MECLKKTAERMPFLETFEKRAGVKREYSLLGIGLFFLVIIMATSLGPIITATVGIVVPLQETLVILKQVNPKREEMRHMIVFWMVFGILTSFDAYSGPIIGLIPLWYTIKFFFLLWAGPLKFKAGALIYDNVLARIPEEWYAGSCGIETAVKNATDAVKTAAEDGLKKDRNVNEGFIAKFKTMSQDGMKTWLIGTAMIVDLTKPFKTLRDTKISARRLQLNLTIEYISRQSKSLNCSLCYEVLDEEGVLCWSCFYKLYPQSVDFKVSFIVEYAWALGVIRRQVGGIGNEKVQNGCNSPGSSVDVSSTEKQCISRSFNKSESQMLKMLDTASNQGNCVGSSSYFCDEASLPGMLKEEYSFETQADFPPSPSSMSEQFSGAALGADRNTNLSLHTAQYLTQPIPSISLAGPCLSSDASVDLCFSLDNHSTDRDTASSAGMNDLNDISREINRFLLDLQSEEEFKRLQYLGLATDHSLEELYRAFLNQNSTELCWDEKLIIGSIKQRIYRAVMNKWTVFQYQSRIEVIDEQSNIMRLKYLLCLRELKIDSALVLKRYMIELKKDQKRLKLSLENVLT